MTKEGTLTVGGRRMDYIVFGKGKRPLVMIQGLNTRGIRGSGSMLALMYRLFAKEYRVYLFDRRQDITSAVTVKELADDLALAMDAMGITQADILGVSQGGMIAQYLALDRPDLVRKMVLAMTLSENNDTVSSVIAGWTGMAKRGEMKQMITDMAEKMYSEQYLRRYRPLLPLLTLVQKPRDLQRFVLLAESCLTCDTCEALPQIKCPVLVIGAKQDKVVGPSASEEIAGKLGCRLHLYEDLGHAAYEEAADFNRLVFDFLKD